MKYRVMFACQGADAWWTVDDRFDSQSEAEIYVRNYFEQTKPTYPALVGRVFADNGALALELET